MPRSLRSGHRIVKRRTFHGSAVEAGPSGPGWEVAGGAAMTGLAMLSGGVAAGLFVYLVVALWRAEEF